MPRSRALIILLALCLAWPAQADPLLCATPGADGVAQPSGIINRYFAAPGVSLVAGQRDIPLGVSRGAGALRVGDLLLLWQVQGATLQIANDERYGVTAMEAGRYEWLRVDALLPASRIRVTGAGPGQGLLHDYPFRDPPDETRAAVQEVPGRARWQLVRVPQFEHATLAGEVSALPWDGASGGVLALDVRGRLALAGQVLWADGAGFRGGAALPLSGALGSDTDWRYPAPDPAALVAGYGQHGSKGEGVAGTPRWILWQGERHDTGPLTVQRGASDGYPGGSMARGAAGNAGGGGNSPAGDGGGGAGADAGAAGGRLGGYGGVPFAVLIPGGGGGAGSVAGGSVSEAGGGAGGGVVLVRAGQLVPAPGVISARGLPGFAGETAGGGGGGGRIALVSEQPVPAQWRLQHEGGPGGRQTGGRGGGGHSLTEEGAGAAPGFVCAPAGTHLQGHVTRSRGAAGPLPGRPVTVQDAAGVIVATTQTDSTGRFALRLLPAVAGDTFFVSVALPADWHVDHVLPAALAHGAGWQITVADEQTHALSLSAFWPGVLHAPAARAVQPGATELLLFRYQAGVQGRVRFRHPVGAAHWQPALLLDPECSGASLYQDEALSRWLPVAADATICVRLRVQVPVGEAGQRDLPLIAEFEAPGLVLAPLQQQVTLQIE